ncbi:hypothetical protein [Mucilaginibacter pocheonensis]|uniref:Uncharacterized protein n=1 Tax=Mucilaginibacter pocheonensis TaxID=398050 RepID=A0ABU1T4V1_9SPHI|nr:hypothetical protein [Mucilaginibacter pocheonensis]MDR6940250.1 hypothetical protein [Mucilaginibacter pocheonensis]
MKAIVKQTKRTLLLLVLLFVVISGGAQVKYPHLLTRVKKKPVPARAKAPISAQYKEFLQLLAQASVSFTFPKNFKEIPAVNNEDFSFDYAMEMPGRDFEVWFQVKSQKENWASYERAQNDDGRQLANPDSLYLDMGKAHATAFTGDRNYFVRNMPQNVLDRYNADAGKSYLLNLLDLPATKHYKYALLITLQRNHTGTIMMVCFTNEKDPEFFKNIDRVSNCLKFKL